MSLEILGAWVAKLGWVTIIPYLGWLYRRDKTNDKFDLMVSLVKAESLESKIQRDEAKKQVKENTSLLCDIKTDVAVLKKEMEYTSRV